MSTIRNVYWLNNTLYLSEKSLFLVVYSRKIFTDEYYPSGYFPRTGTIHPGTFLGRALWADSVSPRMNTIASRDQFKPIRIGENLVVNYKVADAIPAALSPRQVERESEGDPTLHLVIGQNSREQRTKLLEMNSG